MFHTCLCLLYWFLRFNPFFFQLSLIESYPGLQPNSSITKFRWYVYTSLLPTPTNLLMFFYTLLLSCFSLFLFLDSLDTFIIVTYEKFSTLKMNLSYLNSTLLFSIYLNFRLVLFSKLTFYFFLLLISECRRTNLCFV